MASAELSNETIPVLTKTITQIKINQFESCGILDRQNIHNSPELAKQRLGTTYPIASGRMSVAFASESLRKFFGAEVFNHTGTVNLKFLRPVKEGDTITVGGTVNSRQTVDNGTLVTVDLYCENQNGDKTAIGQGTAIVS
jgi:acyl dehydratase